MIPFLQQKRVTLDFILSGAIFPIRFPEHFRLPSSLGPEAAIRKRGMVLIAGLDWTLRLTIPALAPMLMSSRGLPILINPQNAGNESRESPGWAFAPDWESGRKPGIRLMEGQ